MKDMRVGPVSVYWDAAIVRRPDGSLRAAASSQRGELLFTWVLDSAEDEGFWHAMVWVAVAHAQQMGIAIPRVHLIVRLSNDAGVPLRKEVLEQYAHARGVVLVLKTESNGRNPARRWALKGPQQPTHEALDVLWAEMRIMW